MPDVPVTVVQPPAVVVTGPWTIDSLLQYLSMRLDGFDRLSVEADRRYEQRFVAQEQAVKLALERVDKEFHEHLRAAREEIAAALAASEKAINKAEIATEKRFENVNEFRGQLADQARTFMPRAEALQRADTNAEKIEALNKRQQEDVSRINSRLDLNQGSSSGKEAFWGYIAGAVGVVGGIIGVVIAFQ